MKEMKLRITSKISKKKIQDKQNEQKNKRNNRGWGKQSK